MKKILILITIFLSMIFLNSCCHNTGNAYFCVPSVDEQICINVEQDNHKHTYIRFVSVDEQTKTVTFMGRGIDRIQKFNLSNDRIFTVETDSFNVKITPLNEIKLEENRNSNSLGFYINVLSVTPKNIVTDSKFPVDVKEPTISFYDASEGEESELISNLKRMRSDLNPNDFYYKDNLNTLNEVINLLEK